MQNVPVALEIYVRWKVVSYLQMRQTMGFSSGRSKMAWHSAQKGTAPPCARPPVAAAAMAISVVWRVAWVGVRRRLARERSLRSRRLRTETTTRHARLID